ncbi:MAG: hypothetical protein WB992_10575 [Bryobacteraceae bacterium]
MSLRFLACLLTLLSPACAATSTAWETTGFSDFLKGRLSGLSLTSDGTLQLGPSIHFNAALNQPALWSLAASPDGSIYASTGHQGKVFRISPDGKSSVVWTAEQTEVFAIWVDTKGVLYAGSSPNGGLYRIENGKAREIWHSPEKYIWAIQSASDGTLFVATGERGNVYRIDPQGSALLYYETGQANVTALALDPKGHLYAGTDPNGLLYDIAGPKQGTILLDSSLPEIRAIAIHPSGAVYAAAMGGAIATRSAAAASTATVSSGPVVAGTPTVVTVTEASEEANAKPPADQSKTLSSSASGSAATSNTAVVEVSGVEKSSIYRIDPDRTVETLRSSKDDNVYDLLLDGDAIIFSTDDHGRIYRLEGPKTTLLAEPGDGETTRILKAGSALYAGLSNPARLLAFGEPGTGAGSYQSQVHDSTTVARWGHLQWHGTGSGIVFRTRTGNAARPDATWSSWSAPIQDPAGALIQSPSARFIQWRAELSKGSTAQITSVDVPYLPQNTPPVIHSITVTSVVGTNAAKSAANAPASSSAYSITVTDTGQAPAASSSTTATQTASHLQTTQTQISWQADDPDGDKLVYSVYFRAENEKEWQLIRSRMFENTLLLDPDVFADGRYFFRIVASDAPSNAAQYAREAELVSTPVLIDNTPPTVTPGAPTRNGASLDIDVDASDQTSPLRLCEYSLDAGFWQPIEAVDGVTDSPQERFHLHLDKLRPGEHLLVFRVYDSANNAGLARIILR